MKRFIIISLLAAITVPSTACLWFDTYNNYLFSPLELTEFRDRVEQVTSDNWKAYLGSTKEYYWFDAKEIISFARQKGDDLMVSYVGNLEKYLDCARQKQTEQWDYPTKTELAQRKQTLEQVRAYALSKVKTRLRSQHALLYMRCNMMLDRHSENIQFWEQTASQLIETVYKDMMLNIYAGALLKTGHDAEASTIFAEQGDWQSLMTQFYKRRSFQAIRQEYLRDPNAAVLPFLLKDFVNNSQEAVDGPDNIPGKLFIRNISKAEAQQMITFAGQVVAEGKTQTPMLWQSAKAWLEYLFGQRKQATTDILEASKMEGTERMKDNTRVLLLYITAAQAPVSEAFNDYLADELAWLDTKIQGDRFFSGARNRLAHQVLENKYASRPMTAVALLKALENYEWKYYIDTMRVDRLKAYIDYAASSGQTALDRYLLSRQQLNRDSMNDLVGTKYLRLCQWQQAIEWLSRVPLTYYNGMGYAIYAAKRHWNVEPWVKRQWLKEGEEYSDEKQSLKNNPKLEFAREMQKMEGEMKVLNGQALQQRCYDLAVRYAQAHYTGDCWFLMRNGKSASDKLRTNEADLSKKTMELLRQASQTSDFKLKEQALFAMSYGYMYSEEERWSYSEWDSQKADYVSRAKPQSQQYKAFAALADFEKANAGSTSRYVSRCDTYIQFRKTYK